MLISYLPAAAGASEAIDAALCAKVYDGGFREIAEVRVERVVHALSGEPSRAEMAVALDGYRRWKDGLGNVREGVGGFEDAVPPGKCGLGLDDVVHVGLPLGGGRVLVIFRGRVTDVSVAASGSGESARIVALGPEHSLDASDLRGARYASDGTAAVDTDAPLEFNPDGLGNYDAGGSRRAGQPLFGDPSEPAPGADPWAGYWRLGAFWRYVVGNFCPADDARLASALDSPELSREDDAVLPPTRVDGMRPSAALRSVLGAYGLEWWADPFVVVNRWSAWGEPPKPCFRLVKARTSPVKSLRLQPRGEAFSKSGTNVDALAMTFTTRGSVNRWRVEGDFREYEAAFTLVPLWSSGDEIAVDGEPALGNRAHENYDIARDAVHRQWGLNEDGAWAGRTQFDFAAFLGEGVWTERRRRFFAPYSETDDDARKVVVQVESDELSEGWHLVASGCVRLLTDRCGIYFDMADVDGTESALLIDGGRRLALKDVTSVRVTAIVKSDARVACDAERTDSAGSTAEISRVRRDEAFRWVKRFASSAYASEGTGVVRDESGAWGPMAQLATSLRAERSALGMISSVTVPWVELSLRVGERIGGIDGVGLPMTTGAGDEQRSAIIRGITYDFKSQATRIDFRPKRAT